VLEKTTRHLRVIREMLLKVLIKEVEVAGPTSTNKQVAEEAIEVSRRLAATEIEEQVVAKLRVAHEVGIDQQCERRVCIAMGRQLRACATLRNPLGT
jgi:hypothetical protein